MDACDSEGDVHTRVIEDRTDRLEEDVDENGGRMDDAEEEGYGLYRDHVEGESDPLLDRVLVPCVGVPSRREDDPVVVGVDEAVEELAPVKEHVGRSVEEVVRQEEEPQGERGEEKREGGEAHSV